ncbi:MAG: glycosyltransferase family 2 protein [Candidatus Nealsonbacteria bacterium]|nr:glycosyltransferase family 2 protein [Candidatus Nealsonbacteria bacterium]
MNNRMDKNKFTHRIFEIFPGALTWSTFILSALLSWLKPNFVAFFIISFAVFWLLRTIYLSLYLRSGYQKMKKHEKIDWLEKVKKIEDWKDIYHLVILPTYKEPLEIVRESFASLANSDYPKEKMIVVLATEARAGLLARETAEEIEKEFGNKFFKFLATEHEDGLAGEIQGKGSNEAWATKTVKDKIIDKLKMPYDNIIVSSFDADTVVFPKYFSCLTYHYLTNDDPTKTSFQPIPLFINNIWQAPVFSRLFSFATTFWQTMNQERPESLITFSSHSMSFKALVDSGFRQRDAVSDDSRIFWQCFFRYNGNYKVQPLFYPVSMDANVSKSFWRTTINIYKQQRRWAYGVADISYFLSSALKNKKVPLAKKLVKGLELIEGHWSWATAPLIIFLLGWLPLIFGGEQFSQSLFSYNLPKITSLILTFAMVGLVISAYLSIVLLPPKPPKYGKYKYFIFVLEWLFLPIVMVFFSALPAIEAQTRLMFGKYLGFWPTEKFRH